MMQRLGPAPATGSRLSAIAPITVGFLRDAASEKRKSEPDPVITAAAARTSLGVAQGPAALRDAGARHRPAAERLSHTARINNKTRMCGPLLLINRSSSLCSKRL